MDLKDAALMLRGESAGHPGLTSLAQSVYEQLARGEAVGYQQLDRLIGEASGKGVLRALHASYSPVAYQAIIMPILAEIDRQKPVPPRPEPDPEQDPLLATAWPPR
jgi:hypothetical protein